MLSNGFGWFIDIQHESHAEDTFFCHLLQDWPVPNGVLIWSVLYNLRTMNRKIQVHYDRLQTGKESLFRQLQPCSEDQLRWKPTGNQWSVLQVLDHLHFAESGSLNYCKKKLLAGDQMPGASLFNSVRMEVYDIILYSRIKIKAPAVVISPSNERNLEEMKSLFDQTSDDLKAFLDEYPDEFLNKGIYKHPMAGRITLPAMVKFFNAHLIHHRHQINRLLHQQA